MYITLFLTKTSISQTKNSCFFLFVLVITLLLQILGDGCMGRPPPQTFGDRPPQCPLGLGHAMNTQPSPFSAIVSDAGSLEGRYYLFFIPLTNLIILY